MINLKASTPAYRGCPRPPTNGGGLFSQLLCYLFGGGVPGYRGNGQPAPRSCGFALFPATPAYRELPVLDPSPDPDPRPDDGCRVESDDGESGPNGYDDGEAGPSGPITIVVR